MAIQLSNLWNNRIQQQNVQGTNAVNQGQSPSQGSGAPSLAIGTTLQGTVEDMKGDMIYLKLSGNQTLTAQMDSSMTLGKGDMVSFVVSGKNDEQLILKSLFTNLATQATGEKALMQAGIDVGPNSLSMVSEMMKNNMSIDQNSLLTMYKDVINHPELSGQNIVSMNRLQIPLTDENIKQFQSYQNLEHQILGAANEITDSMMDAFSAVAKENSDAAATLMKDMVQIFGQDLSEEDKAVLFKDTSVLAEDANVKEGQTAETIKKDLANESQEKTMQAGGTSRPATAELLRELGMSEEGVKSYQEGKLDATKLIGFLKESIQSPELSEKQAKEIMLKLFSSEDMKSAMKEVVGKSWTLDEQKVLDKDELTGMYNRIRQQTGQMNQSLSQLNLNETRLFEQVMNLKDNVDFMQQLNQTMSYVQLPLKLQGDDAHGDLYVYSNKKNFASEDGSVSAFLHLDMDHLGPVDVHVTLLDQKVGTDFYLRDDEMIDFISAHIDQLNERLEKKGYTMNAKIMQKEDKSQTSIMEEIITDHREHQIIASQSFDVRA